MRIIVNNDLNLIHKVHNVSVRDLSSLTLKTLHMEFVIRLMLIFSICLPRLKHRFYWVKCKIKSAF